MYRRGDLPRGTPVPGPLLVEERETTIVIGPAGMAERDENENIVVRRVR